MNCRDDKKDFSHSPIHGLSQAFPDRLTFTSGFDEKLTLPNGGRGGIRTHGRIAPTPDFESGAFNHSATLPVIVQPLTNILWCIFCYYLPSLHPSSIKKLVCK